MSHWDKANTNFLIHAWKTQDFEEIKRVINCYDVFADGPWGGTDLYKFLIKQYPQEKFILTERDAESWFNSLKNMAGKFLLPENEILEFHYYAGMYGFVNWIEHFFGVPTISDDYKDKIIAKYLQTNQNIKDECKRKNIELLILNTSELNEWKAVCDFVGSAVPNYDVPRANTGVEKGQFSIEEGVILVRYYLSKNNLEGAANLLKQIVSTGASGTALDVLKLKVQSAITTRNIMQVK